MPSLDEHANKAVADRQKSIQQSGLVTRKFGLLFLCRYSLYTPPNNLICDLARVKQEPVRARFTFDSIGYVQVELLYVPEDFEEELDCIRELNRQWFFHEPYSTYFGPSPVTNLMRRLWYDSSQFHNWYSGTFPSRSPEYVDTRKAMQWKPPECQQVVDRPLTEYYAWAEIGYVKP